MTDYRRLISYIYAYEGGVKGKNIGFAKIEIRGEQCRIYVNVKRVYVGSNDIGVYLLTPGDEILLGRIFIRGGNGEFRINVDRGNIEGSGCKMETCYGLSVHDVESTWQCYTTIWEDAVNEAAETALSEVTAEHVRGQEVQAAELSFPISEEIARELEKEEQTLEAKAPWDQDKVEMESEETGNVEVSEEKIEAESEPQQDAAVEVSGSEERQGHIEELGHTERLGRTEQRKLPRQPEPAEVPVLSGQPKPVEQPKSLAQPESTEAPVLAGQSQPQPADPPMACLQPTDVTPELPPEPENAEKLQELDRQEQEELARNHLWNRLERRYTKVLAFDYDNGCEILSIKPQDIGLLPREIWVYGNNSFLLHGYYSYRHLILAKLDNPKGDPRYLLGVPGHYFSNEKYMASMFGFPHFVLARRQPENDGRFGYWYTDIRL